MSKSQNRQYSGATYSGAIDVSPTTALNTLPTVAPTMFDSNLLNR
jgi:hypothetical protein